MLEAVVSAKTSAVWIKSPHIKVCHEKVLKTELKAKEIHGIFVLRWELFIPQLTQGESQVETGDFVAQVKTGGLEECFV